MMVLVQVKMGRMESYECALVMVAMSGTFLLTILDPSRPGRPWQTTSLAFDAGVS